MDISKELVNFNKDLADQGVKLRIEKRGDHLNLRGPLPCRTTKESTRVQRISLHLPANQIGLIEAKKVLQLILLQLQHNQFDWKHWTNKHQQQKKNGIKGDALETVRSFKDSFFSDPNRKKSISGSKTTWSSAYQPYLRRLIEIKKDKCLSLDINLLRETLASYAENSRSRQQCATTLAAFARHIDLILPGDWSDQASGYGLHKARFRDLPSDNKIKEAWLQIPNRSWRMAYGLMATYGLRNHEIFFCDLSCFQKHGDKVLRILPNTKTGEHQAWPFHPNWVEFFGLEELTLGKEFLPKVNTNLLETTLQQVGRRVAEQFRRYKLPLTPYDLRHAWAVRTIHIGLPDSVAARMMGHSVAIHTRTYHHWITRRDQQQAVDNALSRKTAV